MKSLGSITEAPWCRGCGLGRTEGGQAACQAPDRHCFALRSYKTKVGLARLTADSAQASRGQAQSGFPLTSPVGKVPRSPPFAHFSFLENKPAEEVSLAAPALPPCHLNCSAEVRVLAGFSTCSSWFPEIRPAKLLFPLTSCQSTTPFRVASALPALVWTWR